MAAHNRENEALELLSRSERELVVGILRRPGQADRSVGDSREDPDDTVFLRLAQLRLRNIVEKHSEALKRARLAGRSGGSRKQVEALQLQLWICSEALAICRRQLKPADERS